MAGMSKVKVISRLFVGMPAFEKGWSRCGLTDEDRRALELLLLHDPKAGAVIQGTNGVRKVRHPLPGRGKSGGVRVFYFDFETLGRIYLLAVIQKGDQGNLTKEERNDLGALIAAMKKGIK